MKPSVDPLSNVSALSYLKLVSIYQVPTKSYWASMIKEETLESKALKEQIAEEYIRKLSEVSFMSTTKDSFNEKMDSLIASMEQMYE